MKKIGLISLTLATLLSAVEVKEGWDLLGTGKKINLLDVENSCIDTIWSYNYTNGWKVFKPNQLDVSDIVSIDADRGFWIKGKSGCSNDILIEDEEANRIYIGQLIINEEIISDATVTIDGIEANNKTDENGSFIIEGLSNDKCQLLSVTKEFYNPLTIMVDTTIQDSIELCEDDLRKIDDISFEPIPAPNLDVSLVDESYWMIANNCEKSILTISGSAVVSDRDNLLNDIVLLIDTSGSTAKSFNVNKSVLDAEVDALKSVIDSFSNGNHLLGSAKFSRYYEKDTYKFNKNENIWEGESNNSTPTRILQELTTDSNLVIDSFNNLVSDGGTDISNGIKVALDLFDNVESRTIPITVNGEIDYVDVEAQKSIVLITDGIPTLPYGSGETQNRRDRVESRKSARLAKSKDVKIFPIVIEREDGTNANLTTMSEVKAIAGASGAIVKITFDNLENISSIIKENINLSEVAYIEISVDNLAPQLINLGADGTFNENIELNTSGEHTIKITASSGITSSSKEFKIYVYKESEVTNKYNNNLFYETKALNMNNIIGADESVIIKDDDLVKLLKEHYPNSKQFKGTQNWHIGESINSEAEFLFTEAGYKSDVGYFIFDINNPPTTKEEVLNTITQDNILFNTASFRNSKNYQEVGLASEYSNSETKVNIDLNSVGLNKAIGFFIIPNGKLADAKAGTTKEPLFTLSNLNPAGKIQHISFYDQDSKKVILGFEDVTRTSSSDEDYQDIVFSVNMIDPKMNLLTCNSYTEPEPEIEEEEINIFGSNIPIDGKNNFSCNVYELEKNTKKLPDFSKLTAISHIYTEEFNIPRTKFDQGFLNATNLNEWFALECSGEFNIDEKGNYKFSLTSDDGSKLYIDEKSVINNDGQHSMRKKEKNLKLESGTHSVKLEYFQGPKWHIGLELKASKKDSSLKIFNLNSNLE